MCLLQACTKKKKRPESYDYLPVNFKKIEVSSYVSENIEAIEFSKNSTQHLKLNHEILQKGSVLLSNIVDSVWYCKLETSPRSLVSTIVDLQVYDDNIYLLDIDQSLFIFSIDGVFVKKIDNKGKGPGEYLDINCFTIDPFKKRLIFLDDRRNQLNYYSLDGDFIEQKIAPFYFNEIEFVDENLIFVNKMRRNTSHLDSIDLYQLFGIDGDLRISKIANKYNLQRQGNFHAKSYRSLVRGKDEIFYHPMFSNSIYSLKDSEFQELYRLDLGSYGLPNDYDYDLNSGDFWNTYSDKYVFATKYIINQSIVFIELESWNLGKYYVVLNRKSNNLEYGKKINKNVENSILFDTPRFVKGDTAFSIVSSLAVSNSLEAIDNAIERNLVEIDAQHYSFLSKVRGNENPIVVFSKLK